MPFSPDKEKNNNLTQEELEAQGPIYCSWCGNELLEVKDKSKDGKLRVCRLVKCGFKIRFKPPSEE